jgi:hypothetical protein
MGDAWGRRTEEKEESAAGKKRFTSWHAGPPPRYWPPMYHPVHLCRRYETGPHRVAGLFFDRRSDGMADCCPLPGCLRSAGMHLHASTRR